jgi:nucleoid DNA-binding protein
MNELVNLIVKKTGIPAATAQTIVKMVIDFVKKKLPAPVGAQIDGLLSSDVAVKKAENVLGNLTSQFGKKKK